jgi:hypothetical protein
MRRRLSIVSSFAAVLLLASAPRSAAAQTADIPRQQMLSVQPLTTIAGLISADYERAIARPGLTVGAGLSYLSSATVPGLSVDDIDVSYLSLEGKVRYYLGGVALRGFSVGATVGGTSAHVKEDGPISSEDSGRLSGIKLGTELDYLWRLGRSDRLGLAVGLGAKRVFYSASASNQARAAVNVAYPTARLAIGWAF